MILEDKNKNHHALQPGEGGGEIFYRRLPAVRRPSVSWKPKVGVAEASRELASAAGHVDHSHQFVLCAIRSASVTLARSRVKGCRRRGVRRVKKGRKRGRGAEAEGWRREERGGGRGGR